MEKEKSKQVMTSKVALTLFNWAVVNKNSTFILYRNYYSKLFWAIVNAI
jgi:hypothetical protein